MAACRGAADFIRPFFLTSPFFPLNKPSEGRKDFDFFFGAAQHKTELLAAQASIANCIKLSSSGDVLTMGRDTGSWLSLSTATNEVSFEITLADLLRVMIASS